LRGVGDILWAALRATVAGAPRSMSRERRWGLPRSLRSSRSAAAPTARRRVPAVRHEC
jgi:hypothetical protein